MSTELWATDDDYIDALFVSADQTLSDALLDSTAAGLPPINVAPSQGKLLELLAKLNRSRRILEIGTLGGYSTIWLARSLPDDGELVTLELDVRHAAVARQNIDRAGFGSKVEIRVGPAADSLRDMISEGVEPFDFVFIDADKEGYPQYFTLTMELSRYGTDIVADNVVRAGAVIDPASSDERVQGVRRFLDLASNDDRVEGTVIQTVGSKGYAGFALLRVNN